MVELFGLMSSSPICAMAAMGLLRVLGQDFGLDVRLGWRQGHACIEGIEKDEVIECLVNHMTDRAEALEWNWSMSTRKVVPETYRAACDLAAANGDQRALAFMAAWASDTVLHAGKDEMYVTPTAMDLTSGSQNLIDQLRRLAVKLKEQPFAKRVFGEALDGGAHYHDQHSFGWDPATVRYHAHEWKAPGELKSPGKPGLIWLAAESLPLHPVVPVSSSKALPLGWHRREDRRVVYYWSAWRPMLGLDEVRLLRAMPLAGVDKRRGVDEVWCSMKGSSGKYPALLPSWRER